MPARQQIELEQWSEVCRKYERERERRDIEREREYARKYGEARGDIFLHAARQRFAPLVD